MNHIIHSYSLNNFKSISVSLLSFYHASGFKSSSKPKLFFKGKGDCQTPKMVKFPQEQRHQAKLS